MRRIAHKPQIHLFPIIWVFAVSILLFGSLAHATSPNDFYCRRITDKAKSALLPTEPIYFQKAVKSCGAKNEYNMEGICQQQVECAFVSASMKQNITAQYSQNRPTTFDALPVDVKVRALNNNGVEWLPSTVTCKAMDTKLNGKEPICPSPNACKGDLNFHPQEAINDPADMVNDLNNAIHGGSGAFKHETEAGAAK